MMEEFRLPSTSSISVPNSKVPRMIDLFSDENDWTLSNPSSPDITLSIGPVTSLATASGFADG